MYAKVSTQLTKKNVTRVKSNMHISIYKIKRTRTQIHKLILTKTVQFRICKQNLEHL